MKLTSKISTRPVPTDQGQVPGFYAETNLEIGWFVQHFGETAQEAEANLRRYVESGEFEKRAELT
jgi:hypothetical protein